MTKKDLKKIKQFSHTEKGKSTFFFGFYFVFFLVLIILIRMGNNNIVNSNNEEDNDNNINSNLMYKVDKIYNNNYRFNYNINIDGLNYIYSGSKYNNKELFIYNNKNYYREDDNYYYNDIINNKWISINNPYIFNEFINFTRLGEVLVDSTYISKEEFSTGDRVYKYKVSSNSIINRIEGINTDIEEVPNDVEFISDKDNYLYKINLNLTNYGKYKSYCKNNLNIVITYSDFGKVEEINKPI